MNYIIFDKVNKSYGYENILDSLSFKILKGEHIGLIGNNGCGKTTIFRIITGSEGIDSGRVVVRPDIKIGYLEQSNASYSGKKIIDVLKMPFIDIFNAIEKLKNLEYRMGSISGVELERLLDEYGRLQSYVEFRDGYNLDSKILTVATGLGMDTSRFDENLDNLSGGERTRVFLCKLLLEEPDILLLDEPTNHLDIIAVGWLEQYLSTYKGTIITVSHDRAFLDNSVKKIIEIEGKTAVEYPGNYSWYKKEKKRRREIQTKQFTNQQKEINRLEKTAKRMREWANQADNEKMYKLAVNVEKRIEHMDKIEKPTDDKKSMKMNLSNTSKSGKEVIRLDDIHKSFSNTNVLSGVSIMIRRGEKVVISGENGSGKTTILNIINGRISCDDGYVKVGEGIKTGYLPQDVSFEDENRTLLDEVRRALGPNAAKAHKVLAAYGFKGEHVMKKIKDLSGGERKRLRFSTMMQQEYNLLIMDEPTNHMDIGSREILEESLMKYTGTCLFISHDRFFINKTSSRRYLLRDGKLIEYSGEYTNILKPSNVSSSGGKTEVKKSNQSRVSKNRMEFIRSIEIEIKEIETKISETEAKMMNHLPLEELNILLKSKENLEHKLHSLYTKWEEASV